MIRIDVDLFDDAAQSQLNDTPIMSWGATAAGLPSIHPFAAVGVLIGDEDSAAGLHEILLRREELIVREQCDAADALSREINESGRRRYSRIRCPHKLPVPNSKLQRTSKLQTATDART